MRRKVRRKVLLIVLAVVLLGGTLGGSLYWYWVDSPRYALQQMALALKTRNMDNFFKYLDLKAILNNFLDASSAEPNQSDDGKADEWTQLSRNMGRKLSRVLLPKLFDTFAVQIRTVLEKYLLNLDNSQILGVAAAATTAKIERQGEAAQVTLVDPKTNDLLRFQMRRETEPGSWRIISVNYQDIKNFYKRRSKEP
jgi:hypothetical protein